MTESRAAICYMQGDSVWLEQDCPTPSTCNCHKPHQPSRPTLFGWARACILVYKYGLPPQHETFAPKPTAPADIQGELKATPTNIPGIHIGERLPKIAAIMDRLTVVRSLTHSFPLHGTVYATTGIPDVDTKIESLSRHQRQWPYIGSLVDYLEERKSPGQKWNCRDSHSLWHGTGQQPGGLQNGETMRLAGT